MEQKYYISQCALHRLFGALSHVWIVWRKDKSVAPARNSKSVQTCNEQPTHYSDNTILTPTS